MRKPRQPKKRFLSWRAVERLTIQLARLIKRRRAKYDVYIGIARGGMFPALLLAQVFDQGVTLTTHLRRYKKGKTSSHAAPIILSFPRRKDIVGRRILVIDEVWDHGDSIVTTVAELYRLGAKQVDVAVLHFKPGNNLHPGRKPTYFVTKTKEWIVYPWEQFSAKVHAQHV